MGIVMISCGTYRLTKIRWNLCSPSVSFIFTLAFFGIDIAVIFSSFSFTIAVTEFYHVEGEYWSQVACCRLLYENCQICRMYQILCFASVFYSVLNTESQLLHKRRNLLSHFSKHQTHEL